MTETDKEQGPRPDLVINGVGSAAGGIYGKVLIDGVGKVGGSLTARLFKANGQIRVKGGVKSREMEVNGILNLDGPLEISTLKLDGILHVDGSLTGESCVLNGLVTAKGDCELEEFRGVGGFTIEGLLSAGHIDIRLAGAGKAHEIGVESLKIRQEDSGIWNRLLGGIIPKLRPALTARVIEGDNLDLEYTAADIVRGGRVIIGAGCSVGLVEYRDRLTVHPEARIGREVKTGD
ncbi:cytoskeletal protein CcmA (bactofilin family) [Paenibacillus forsythiae]|uniref:Cytoskeletal protein CcmA (Bactofilin family) n=1 Tax=Paenibacillus forsythiae TaxID=365616 RepID=A0ABU3H7C8_9BACL|nr:hypothetical protein [Paenibacillus forsythiae]MDT3426730.1 cytoskeletal protein CcmA (bactofilin family) [Paenibacillus forsythiae]